MSNHPITPTPTSRIVPHVRWMIRRDMPRVLEIEQLCFRDPWDEKEFTEYLKQRSVVPMVAEHEEQVLGFMVYELQINGLQLHDLAVVPARQRRGVGRALIQKLISKLSWQRRRYLRVNVADYNLDAQLFFQRLGFLAKGVDPEAMTTSDGSLLDAFMFEYRLTPEGT